MKTKKIILTVASVLALSVCSIMPAVTVSASSQEVVVEQYGNSITPRSDIKKWIYKVEDGKIYKRLYNASTDTWLGDWIYVGEYTG